MRKIIIILFLFFIIGLLYAQENPNPDFFDRIEQSDNGSSSEFSYRGLTIGLGPEINIYTRDGFALGGTAAFGIDFHPQMSAGLRVSFFNDLSSVSVLELQGVYRYYLPWVKNLFLEAHLGMMLAFEHDKTFPAFAGSALVGYRLDLSENFYIDFGARFGYPQMGAGNIIFGFKIPKNGNSDIEQTIYEGVYNE